MRIPLPPKPMPVIVATLDGKHSAQAEAFIQSAIEDERVRGLVRYEIATVFGAETATVFGAETATYEEVVATAAIRLERFDRLRLAAQVFLRILDGRDHLTVRLTTTGERL